MTKTEKWVIDATMGIRDGLFCFCPIEFDEFGEVTSIVTGLNVLGTEPPRGKCVGVVHEDGQEAVEAFCEANKKAVDAFFDAQKANDAA